MNYWHMPTHTTSQTWSDCYTQLAPKLVLYARQWLTSQADAEDVVQQAFVKFWRRQPDASAEHWPLLYATVRTTALDFLRSTERRSRREQSVAATDTPWFEGAGTMSMGSIEQREHAEAMQEALQQLSTAQREVVVLRIWAELTFQQIAEMMGESINTVASRYRYALEALRRTMKAQVYERA